MERTRLLVSATLLVCAVASVSQLGTQGPAQASTRNPDRERLATSSGTAGTKSNPPEIAAPAPLTKPLVILYGDSLAWEAKDSFVGAFAGQADVRVLTRTWGGTAICDWLDEMKADAVAFSPDAVVLEFSGNNLTPCMQDAAGRGLVDDAYWARYRADTRTAIEIFSPTRTRVFLAGAPMSQLQAITGDFHGGMVNAMYEAIAAEYPGVLYVDAGTAVLDYGRWTPSLPCLPTEPCTGGTDLLDRGFNVVRAPDGGHFCPAAEEAKRGVVDACPIWSSGAFRYGNAMAAPVLTALGR
jgi:hypothetical protein